MGLVEGVQTDSNIHINNNNKKHLNHFPLLYFDVVLLYNRYFIQLKLD